MRKYGYANRLLSLESKHENAKNEAATGEDSVYFAPDGPVAEAQSVYYAPDEPVGSEVAAMSHDDYTDTIETTALTAIPHDFYIKEDGTILTVQGNSNTYRYFMIKRPVAAECYQEVLRVDKNEHGLVLFPDNGTGFGRYGTVDAGGKQGGVTYGHGDHFVLPETAAALLGLTTYLNREYNFTLDLGDMSSSNGQDPWQPGFEHHAGHGHGGNRKGLDVDFRYLNTNGVSFQSSNAFASSSFSATNNQRVFDTAKTFGFTRNYQGTSGTLSGVTKVSGHNDHGHLGLVHSDLNWRNVPNAPGQVVAQSISGAQEVYDDYEEINSTAFGEPFSDIKSDKFRKFLPQILKFEGGFVNDPDDPGGATNKGITWGTFQRHAQTVLGIAPTLENLKNITDAQAGKIYELIYWNKLLAEDINDVQVAYQYVDFYINAGHNAIKVMQRTLNSLGQSVTVDGRMGPKTLAAINAIDGAQLFEAFKKYRQQYYNNLAERRPNMKKFLGGWTKRTNHFVYQNSLMGTSMAHTHSGLLTHVNGWLRVKLNSGKIVSLSQFARVSNVGSSGNRETFTINDWPYAGQGASVSKQPGGASRFGSTSYQDGGTVVFDSAKNKLKFGTSAWIPTAMDTSNPLPKGTYKIWLPDYPHTGGGGYSSHSQYSTVWFRLGGESSSRYLHLGNVSLGCVTFGATSAGGTDAHKAQWTELYNYLIKRRVSNGGNYVGELEVV
ncbi:MAG: glycoside hydrolase family 108 protein [Fluviicola sp.]